MSPKHNAGTGSKAQMLADKAYRKAQNALARKNRERKAAKEGGEGRR